MKFSTKTRYGIRTMLEIAIQAPEKGSVYQKDIAEKQGISVKYLDHIIHALKVAGLITNVKGKKSGYILTRKPEDITILDIHNAFEPGICVIDCLSQSIHCDREKYCSARGFWGGLNNLIRDYFQSITLLNLVENEKSSDE